MGKQTQYIHVVKSTFRSWVYICAPLQHPPELSKAACVVPFVGRVEKEKQKNKKRDRKRNGKREAKREEEGEREIPVGLGKGAQISVLMCGLWGA